MDPTAHGLASAGDGFFNHWPLGRAKPSEHMLHGRLVPRSLHPNPKPGVFGRSQMILDVTETIMAPVSSPGSNSQLAERQVEIIANNQQVRKRQLVEVNDFPNTSAA